MIGGSLHRVCVEKKQSSKENLEVNRNTLYAWEYDKRLINAQNYHRPKQAPVLGNSGRGAIWRTRSSVRYGIWLGDLKNKQPKHTLELGNIKK